MPQEKKAKKLKLPAQIVTINMTPNPVPMSRTIHVTPLATARIDLIREWYQENFDEEMADDFYDVVIEKLDLLGKFNEAGPEVINRDGVRRLVITGRFPYSLFYRLTETEVVVLVLAKNAEPVIED